MITEDYISFENAKLLKEKGFDIPTERFYNECGTCCCGASAYNWNDDDGEDCSRPTQAMVMKWLREVHKLYVDICPCVEEEYWNNKWNVYVSKLMNKYPFQQFIGVFTTYEEACEAAMKYCLENLI